MQMSKLHMERTVKICKTHWDMCRTAIKDRGMDGLVAKSSEAALENLNVELEGGKPDFDPLMSMHWHWTNNALRCGGLYLLSLDDNGESYCPICEFEKNEKGFTPVEEIGKVADAMRQYCLDEKLIPGDN